MKSGYKTTEFWLSAAATVVGLVVASGALPSGGSGAKIAGLVAAALASMGYTYARAKVKTK